MHEHIGGVPSNNYVALNTMKSSNLSLYTSSGSLLSLIKSTSATD